MTRIYSLFTSTTLATLIAVPVMADVTADDVWNTFSTYYQAVGLKVEATEVRTDNRLALSNLKISADFPFDLGSFTATTTGFELVENDDGTVDFVVPDNMPIAIAITLPEDIFATATIDYRLTGYKAQAEGDPGEFMISAQLDSAVMEISSLNVSAPKAKDLDFDLALTLSIRDIAGETKFAMGDMLVVSQSMSYGAMEMKGHFTGKDAGAGDIVSTMDMALINMQSSSTAIIPASGINLLELPAQLRDGMSFLVSTGVQQQVSSQRVTANGNLVSDQSTNVENSMTTFGFSKDGALIDSEAENYVIDYSMPELPFPIQLSASYVAAKMGLPLLKSDDEQRFTYLLDLKDITMADGLWNQFDPTATLPRAPANLLLDLSGEGRLFYDLVDFEAMRKAFEEGSKIGEPTSVTLNGMDISAVGAQLTGTGAFTFDNNDLSTFDGLPAPSGTASLRMSGLNALMDNLVQMGLLENDAAFGARMGLGLFTVVGDGDDTLASDIEVKPDGQILANGVRIK